MLQLTGILKGYKDFSQCKAITDDLNYCYNFIKRQNILQTTEIMTSKFGIHPGKSLHNSCKRSTSANINVKVA